MKFDDFFNIEYIYDTDMNERNGVKTEYLYFIAFVVMFAIFALCIK